ncbi:restriction endonuclease subunit S [Mammaliicoccus sciuri]|uniref:restriction endonuclease subunit S n=1 Tax=Mammaliicoccus sciuri TaxID=1296 RepID=UPI002DB9FE0F|nr:restriction endonuclease subunit S [Mammaliicoccus sciuri]MEB7409943.1 restriction endonuclease subunit S [Mammaliicoccus sciuri]
MTNQVKKVPELRFPEFDGKWEEKKLGDIAHITMGQSPKSSNYTNNDQDMVLVQGNADMKKGQIYPRIYTTEITKLAEIDDILLSVRAPVGELAIAQLRACIGRGVCAINANKFVYYNLELFKVRNTWKLFSQGSTFESISGNEIKKINFQIPISKSEQQKIGEFFSKLDRQIELEEQKLAKLEEQKKGYMQKIFSQELRFKDESGNEYPEWEEKKLFDVVKYLSSKRSSNYYSEDIIHGQYPVYDAVQEISRDTNFDIEESYISILKDGAGVGRLNLRPGKSSVIGTMGYLLPQNIDIKFLFYYLKTMNFNRFVIGSTIPHLYFKDYSKETILIPIDKSEQIKIGSFFIKLDRIINNKAKKIKVLKQRKQGFLQKMFV